MYTGRVHEHIYTDKNLFNDFIRLQNKSINEHYVFYGFFFKWNLVLFTSYSNLLKFPVWSLRYLTVHQNTSFDRINVWCVWPIWIRDANKTRAS